MDQSLIEFCLFERFQEGGEQEFALFYNYFVPKLKDYAIRKLNSIDEAHDLVQDLFVSLWEKREKITINKSVSSFMITSLNRRILNLHRSNNYESFYKKEQLHQENEACSNCLSKLQMQDIQIVVDQVLNNMPVKVKKIYKLSRQEYLSNKEIADVMHLSEQTVKNQLSSAIKVLKMKLK